MRRLYVILGLLVCLTASAAEVIPPSPPRHFNDFANVVSSATAERLDQQLADFEKQTTSQLVVAIYPKMQTDSSIEDYTVRVFRAWKVGQKDKNNGAVMFLFVQDHKMRIATGYGLEGALPDVLCKRILDDEMAPHLKQGDFNGGLTTGVAAMIAAAKGEYKAKTPSVGDKITNGIINALFGSRNSFSGLWCFFAIFIILILSAMSRGRSRYRSGWVIGGGGWSGGGWGGGGGGDSGGFSGGGGSTGGGGASGSW